MKILSIKINRTKQEIMKFGIEVMSDEIKSKIDTDFYQYQMETTGVIENNAVVFTARLTDALIGVVSVVIKWGQLHIKTVIVDSVHRTRGIESKLMKCAFDYRKSHDCTFALVETVTFKHLNFIKS